MFDRAIQVERIHLHGYLTLRSARPFFLRAVDHQLDAVAVRVEQIDGEIDAVICGPGEFVAGLEDANHQLGQCAARD